MSPRREIEGVNLDRDLRAFRMEDRFCAYEPGGHVSELMSFPDAQRLAATMSDKACVGFVEEPVPAPVVAAVAPVPAVVLVPSYMRRKVKTSVTT